VDSVRTKPLLLGGKLSHLQVWLILRSADCTLPIYAYFYYFLPQPSDLGVTSHILLVVVVFTGLFCKVKCLLLLL